RRYCPHLKRLRINHQTHWQQLHVGDFPGLRVLECQHATVLETVTFGELPQLERLSLAHAEQLQDLENQGLGLLTATAWVFPRLKDLDSQDWARLRHIQLQLAKPQQLIWSTEGCPKLEMPLFVSLQYRVAASLIKKLNGRLISDGLCFNDENRLTISELSALAEGLKSKPPLASLNFF